MSKLAYRESDTYAVRAAASRESEKHYAWGLERFYKEIRLVAKYKHPNIIKITDCFPDNNTAYGIMELIEGGSLEDKLKERKLFSEDEVKAILYPLMDALEETHKSKPLVLHRDIKPANIMMRSEDDSPVLIDFGAARPINDASVTVMQTQGYAPPEQADTDQANLGPWTDVYALAATCYLLLTDKKPQPANSRLANDKFADWKSQVPDGLSDSFYQALTKVLNLEIKDALKA